MFIRVQRVREKEKILINVNSFGESNRPLPS